MRRNVIFSILLLVFPLLAFAAGGKHDGIPPVVMYQALNVFIVLIILHLFVRKPLQQMFATRKSEFESSMAKAQEAKKIAEREFQEIKNRLDEFQAAESQSLEKARKEAEEISQKIIGSAEEAGKNMVADTEKALSSEVEKAKREITTEMLGMALDSARAALKEEMKPEDQSRLQKEFSSRLRAVE